MAMLVQLVPLQYVQQVWPRIEAMLAAALEHSAGEYTTDQLKAYVVMGAQSLLVAVDDQNEIHGACTIAFENYPNHRVAFMTAIGGRFIINPDMQEQLKDWCRNNGATLFRGACRGSVARLLRRMGMSERYTIMEIPL